MPPLVIAGEGLAHVLVAVAHCTGKCVGLHAAKRGDRFEAPEPLRQGNREHFGHREAGAARGVANRQDCGSNDLSDHSQRELRFPGMSSSPSFVRGPEGNECAERFVRALKEQLLWVRCFATVAGLVGSLREFEKTD